jgi:mannose-6-phosphate isomerase
VQPIRLTNERTLLVSSPALVFEKIDLPPNPASCLGADRETWLLVLSGGARTGSFDVTMGDAVFVQSDRVNIRAGTIGMVGLVAYTGGGQAPPPGAAPQTVGAQWMQDGHRRCRCQLHSLEAKTVPTNGRLETTK